MYTSCQVRMAGMPALLFLASPYMVLHCHASEGSRASHVPFTEAAACVASQTLPKSLSQSQLRQPKSYGFADDAFLNKQGRLPWYSLK